MNKNLIYSIALAAFIVTGCAKEKPVAPAPTEKQEQTAKEIRKGEFKKSSGKTW